MEMRRIILSLLAVVCILGCVFTGCSNSNMRTAEDTYGVWVTDDEEYIAYLTADAVDIYCHHGMYQDTQENYYSFDWSGSSVFPEGVFRSHEWKSLCDHERMDYGYEQHNMLIRKDEMTFKLVSDTLTMSYDTASGKVIKIVFHKAEKTYRDIIERSNYALERRAYKDNLQEFAISNINYIIGDDNDLYYSVEIYNPNDIQINHAWVTIYYDDSLRNDDCFDVHLKPMSSTVVVGKVQTRYAENVASIESDLRCEVDYNYYDVELDSVYSCVTVNDLTPKFDENGNMIALEVKYSTLDRISHIACVVVYSNDEVVSIGVIKLSSSYEDESDIDIDLVTSVSDYETYIIYVG